MKLKKAADNGINARKIIVVPCIVNSSLNVSALTKSLSGFMSCQRISIASRPPISKNTNAVAPYRMPMRLWSVVVIQLQSRDGDPKESGVTAVASIYRYLKLWRYATSPAISSSVNPVFGMRLPGFTAAGSRSQAARLSAVFSSVPLATVDRLPMWFRSGPNTPAETPWIAWHAMHELDAGVRTARKMASPCCCKSLRVSAAAGALVCSATQESKSAAVWTKARNRMLA